LDEDGGKVVGRWWEDGGKILKFGDEREKKFLNF